MKLILAIFNIDGQSELKEYHLCSTKDVAKKLYKEYVGTEFLGWKVTWDDDETACSCVELDDDEPFGDIVESWVNIVEMELDK